MFNTDHHRGVTNRDNDIIIILVMLKPHTSVYNHWYQLVVLSGCYAVRLYRIITRGIDARTMS